MRTQPLVVYGKITLKNLDPGYCDGLDKKKTRKLANKYGRRIGELQELLYANSK